MEGHGTCRLSLKMHVWNRLPFAVLIQSHRNGFLFNLHFRKLTEKRKCNQMRSQPVYSDTRVRGLITDSPKRFRFPQSRNDAVSQLPRWCPLTFHVDPRQDVLKGGCMQQVTHFFQRLGRSGRRLCEGVSLQEAGRAIRGWWQGTLISAGVSYAAHSHADFSTETPSLHPC